MSKHSPFKNLHDLAKKVQNLQGPQAGQPSGTIESGRVGARGDRFDIESIRLSANPDELLRQVHEILYLRQQTTEHKEWLHQQRERQARVGIRGGGAPASREEAAAQMQEIIQQRTGIYLNVPNMTESERKAAAKAALDAAIKFDDTFPNAKVAILFKSGGPFIYPSSVPSQYIALQKAGSKGKCVWHELGWGPNRSPSYLPVVITPDRVLLTEGVTSSWLLQIWLLAS